jgi:hypothetical protein
MSSSMSFVASFDASRTFSIDCEVTSTVCSSRYEIVFSVSSCPCGSCGCTSVVRTAETTSSLGSTPRARMKSVTFGTSADSFL